MSTPRLSDRLPERHEAGFSLLEMLIATALFMIVTGGIFGLLSPASGTYRAQPEAADMQQRLRVAVDTIRRDLVMAGAGTYTRAAAGALVNAFAPIVPHRVPAFSAGFPDQPDPSAITITYVAPTASQTLTRSELAGGSTSVQVAPAAGCPAGGSRVVCGFEQGMRVAVFDGGGAYDIFTVAAADDRVHLEPRDGTIAWAYAPGASMAAVVSVTYYLNRQDRRLYRFDGHRTTLPVVDDVVDLRFEYFGDPRAPALRRPVTDVAGAWTTYGPRPPPADVDRPGDDWGPGENCTFVLVGDQHVSRLESWNADPAGPLVRLPYAALGDGPWCPGLSTATGVPLSARYDADLLRVRRVRVTLRVQAASVSLRGPNPPGRLWFVNPGLARAGERLIRDQEIRFDVTPRNLNPDR